MVLLGPRVSQGLAQVALIALIPALLRLTAPSGGPGAPAGAPPGKGETAELRQVLPALPCLSEPLGQNCLSGGSHKASPAAKIKTKPIRMQLCWGERFFPLTHCICHERLRPISQNVLSEEGLVLLVPAFRKGIKPLPKAPQNVPLCLALTLCVVQPMIQIFKQSVNLSCLCSQRHQEDSCKEDSSLQVSHT